MSESEICQLSYTGNLDILKVKLSENGDLARRPDQVWVVLSDIRVFIQGW